MRSVAALAFVSSAFRSLAIEVCQNLNEGVCYSNSENRIAQHLSPNASDCCTFCGSRSDCASYTWYVKDGAPTCNLFSTVGAIAEATACTSGASVPRPPSPRGAKNVLYFIVDDLRTQLGAYGHKETSTPNIDGLASRGLTFTRAYCQEGVCAPSRNSFMSGRYPDSIRTWTFTTNFRSCGGDCADWVTLPQHFKNNGYLTLGGGKTYHPGRPKDWDEPLSWSQDRPYFPFAEPGCPNPMQVLEPSITARGPAPAYNHSFCPLDLPLSEFFDHQLADWAIDTLRYAADARQTAGTPFFVAVGLRRPHAPWRMPMPFWEAAQEQAPPAHPLVPEGQPAIAFTCGDQCYFRTWLNTSTPHCGELCDGSAHHYTREEPLDATIASLLRRAYSASVSFMDFEIGRILDELKSLGLQDDTLVVLHGDHGWGLGENNHWHKFANSEDTARVPLIVAAPWKAASIGQRTDALASLVDLYPTMASMASAGLPAVPVDGTDISAVFEDPSSATYPYAFSQFPRCPVGGDPTKPEGWASNYCKSSKIGEIQWMGYSVREERLRATAWLPWNGTTLRADWSGDLLGNAELYDHEGNDGSDFDGFPLQHANVVNREEHAEGLQRLMGVLKEFYDRPSGGPRGRSAGDAMWV